jgi:hypothetical protein
MDILVHSQGNCRDDNKSVNSNLGKTLLQSENERFVMIVLAVLHVYSLCSVVVPN